MSSLFLALIVVLSPAAPAQDRGASNAVTRDLSAYANRPHVRATRLEPGETISVDGRLNESVWQRAMPASGFLQQEPDNGAPATERTEVRFVYSKTSLYMGVTCFDSEPDKLLGNTMQRDSSLSSGDRFMWSFDPYLDGRSGYFFEMNPSGAMGDSLISAADSTGGFSNNAARAWDGIWFAKVNRSGIGWTLEIEIPFRTVKFDPNAPAWGANFQRTIRRKNEETFWTGFARNQGIRMMQSAGLLEGISDVSQGIGLDVQPYTTGNYLDARGRNRGDYFKGDVGGDLTYSITPELKVNFTVNTDFAETEVDQRQVNLTRFPLLYPEKRGFFLEGSTFFDFEQSFRVSPFFSRRIGLDENGQPQRIEYGTKLTGQAGSNDIGFLQVRTANTPDVVLVSLRVAIVDFSGSRLPACSTPGARNGTRLLAIGTPSQPIFFWRRPSFAATRN
jgi:hypothetical protein